MGNMAGVGPLWRMGLSGVGEGTTATGVKTCRGGVPQLVFPCPGRRLQVVGTEGKGGGTHLLHRGIGGGGLPWLI
jgi:hypothetical protein